jgi:hypothetical protein
MFVETHDVRFVCLCLCVLRSVLGLFWQAETRL